MSKYEEKYDDDYSDDYGKEEVRPASSLKGYKLVILLMAIILVAVSGLYFYQSNQLRQDFAIERDTLANRMLAIRSEMTGLETNNLALQDSIVREVQRTDSVMLALEKERSRSRSTIRRYEKELGTMRDIMRGYIQTVDSLNTLNRKLISENVGMRKQITSERLRAEMAEERATDMDTKIRQGARVIARDIRLVPLNSNDKEVTRVNRAARLRVDFTLSANSLTNPGNRAVYVRVTGPDGYVLANPGAATFDYEGDPLIYSAMREIDYQNSDLGGSIYYVGSDIASGAYSVEVYMDGLSIGSSEMLLR
jgi:hypothetical protein